MDIIIGIVAFVLMLSVIVVIHEWGHFMVARHFGVYCHEFSIGMGPALYQKQGKQTLFSIRAIPFGGYVMMAGEEDGSQDEDEDWLQNVEDSQRLNFKPWWQQVLVMIAGIVMNVLLAWVIFVGVAISRGYVLEPAKPIVYEVIEDSAADKAGLEKDDHIVKLKADGSTIKPDTQYDVLEFVQYHHEEIELTVKRDTKTFTVTITPDYDKESETYSIGFRSLSNAKYIPWYQCIGVGTQNLIESTTAIFSSLNMLIHGQGLNNLSGPVGIYRVTSKSAQMGWSSYLTLSAMISLNIGIFNALPIPALDGGRILIVLLEKVTRRKMNKKIVENVIIASFVLLLGLFVFATYNDVLRLF